MECIPKKELQRNATSPLYDRALLLHGSKRNEILSLVEIEQYGLDSFADPDYISIYGMKPREWYGCGIRLLGRTAVECTRDALADRIGRDVASVARHMPSDHFVVIDPFAGSCNTLFWILGHLPNSEGIAFESDPQVFELTQRKLDAISHRIELLYGDCEKLFEQLRLAEDRGVIAFIAPPWGAALDETQGLDLCRTLPPVSVIIGALERHFAKHKLLFVIQVYEKLSAPSLSEVREHFDWTELCIYDINEKGRNHGILLGSKGWAPMR